MKFNIKDSCTLHTPSSSSNYIVCKATQMNMNMKKCRNMKMNLKAALSTHLLAHQNYCTWRCTDVRIHLCVFTQV